MKNNPFLGRQGLPGQAGARLVRRRFRRDDAQNRAQPAAAPGNCNRQKKNGPD